MRDGHPLERSALDLATAGLAVERARVVGADTGELRARLTGGREIACDLLEGALASGRIPEPDEEVLVAIPGRGEGAEDGRGVVLGVIQRAPARAVEESPDPADDQARHFQAREIVIDAGSRLELKVGQNRIVITEDGRVLIQGETIISRARGLNKVRGGAVRIN